MNKTTLKRWLINFQSNIKKNMKLTFHNLTCYLRTVFLESCQMTQYFATYVIHRFRKAVLHKMSIRD